MNVSLFGPEVYGLMSFYTLRGPKPSQLVQAPKGYKIQEALRLKNRLRQRSLILSKVAGDQNRVKQSAVLTVGDFEHVLAGWQCPVRNLIVVIIAVNLVPMPLTTRLDRIKAF